MKLILPPFTPEQIRDDVYFRKDFADLHARGGKLVSLGQDIRAPSKRPRSAFDDFADVVPDDFFHASACVPIPGTDRFDLETPWGYGGPIALTVEALRAGMDLWKRTIIEKHGVVAEFVRLHPFLNPAALVDDYDMLRWNRQTVVVNLLESREQRWRRYSDSTKNCIRKASRKFGLRRLAAGDGGLFQRLYEEGLGRNEALTDYYFDEKFFEKLLASPWATTWLASDEEGAASVACFLQSTEGICHYHLAGGNAGARRGNAQYLMLESAIDYYSAIGTRVMCLGGGRSTDPDDALLRFKAKFSPLRMPYFVAGSIYNRSAYVRYNGGRSKFLCDGPVSDAQSAVATVPAAPERASVAAPMICSQAATAFAREGKPIYLIGSGGHAGVLVTTLRTFGLTCAGSFSNESSDRFVSEVPWIGDDEEMNQLDPDGVYLINGVGSISNTNLRRLIYERSKAAGFQFISIVHPSALIESGVTIEEGSQILAGAILQASVSIGANSIVNTGAIVDHDTQIGRHCHIATGARLSGGINIQDGTHVGTGAVVIQGVSLGHDVVVGAGAVVLSDVRPWGRVAGVPARDIGQPRRRHMNDTPNHTNFGD